MFCVHVEVALADAKLGLGFDLDLAWAIGCCRHKEVIKESKHEALNCRMDKVVRRSLKYDLGRYLLHAFLDRCTQLFRIRVGEYSVVRSIGDILAPGASISFELDPGATHCYGPGSALWWIRLVVNVLVGCFG